MTAAQHAVRTAYNNPEAPARTPRSLEYSLLAQTTQRLSLTSRSRADNFAAFAAAVSDNLRLWTALAADVAGAANGLPAQLRAQLYYLYEFTADHSRNVLNDRGSVDVLIDINTAVMRGLRGDGGLA